MSIITVIVPTHNRAQLLQKALESVIHQTEQNYELIIVDNGSQDNTFSSIEPFINQKQLNYYSFQENTNAATARNFGLSKSQGEFIQFLDDDDWLTEDSIAKKLAIFNQNPNFQVVYSDLYLTDAAGKVQSTYFSKRKRPLPSGDIYIPLLHQNFIPIHAMLWRKSALQAVGGFPVRSGHEDWECLLRVAETGQFGVVDQPLGYYRQHSQSMSRKFNTMMEGKLAFQEKIIQSERFQAVPAEIKAKLMVKFAIQQYAYGSTTLGKQFFRTASNISPRPFPQKILANYLLHCPRSFSQWIIRLNTKIKSL